MLIINKLDTVNEVYEMAKAAGKIDEVCIPFCDLFNRIGLKTTYCCEGHPYSEDREQNNEFFHVIFSNNLPDAEVHTLIELSEEANTDARHRFPQGFFYKWYRSVGGIVTGTWIYKITVYDPDFKAHAIQVELERLQAAEQLYLKKREERKDDMFSPWK